jgi:flagellar hook protein FlgE
MTGKWWIGKDVEGTRRGSFLRGSEEHHKNPQDKPFPGWDVNPVPFEYEGESTIRPRRLVQGMEKETEMKEKVGK